jgi:uncharacterized membrane protein
MLLLIVKWIHVLAAIAAVGANFTYGIWIRRAAREPGQLPFVLQGIRAIDRRVANPSYGLLLLTGLVMAYLLPIPLTTPWLLTAIILYVLAAFLGVFAYAPTMREQRKQLEAAGAGSVAFRTASRRGAWLALLVTLDVVMIVFLMVVKPALWG